MWAFGSFKLAFSPRALRVRDILNPKYSESYALLRGGGTSQSSAPANAAYQTPRGIRKSSQCDPYP